MKRRSLVKAATSLAAVTASGGCGVGRSPAVPAAPRPGRHTGTLKNGATWVADVPRRWNGTLVVYSHGYRPPAFFDTNEAQNAPSPEVLKALLDRGYALAGSSYSRLGWVMDTAVRDQLAMMAAVEELIGPPRVRIAFGTSMGGIVTSRLVARGGFDGALTACGALAGGVGIVDNQLHGDSALRELLIEGEDRPRIVGFTELEEAKAAAETYTEAAVSALDNPTGLARFALAAALYHLPTWTDRPDPKPDHLAQTHRQAKYVREGLLTQFFASRVDMEEQAGGIVARNAGTDYARLLAGLDGRHRVRALYRSAGLDLDSDLGRLSAAATVSGDASARSRLQRTSDVIAELPVPHLSVHVVADEAIPAEHEHAYATRIRAAGRGKLLRQAYVGRAGHTEFTPAELVAAVLALARRIDRGKWAGLATVRALQRSASALGLGSANFTEYRPGRFGYPVG
ncbi:alpha/beta hydrolase [Streptomyces sp. V2I9]|uniref:alpha/beta hydrolase n=1 Tax=Streptomyces sp. V2I9 TaxID=3042304 RepID=UPI0027837508|nr:alpha/beta hydrolase [Streptomyces sp. V2I9]MDQ0985300.1 hypothetical protein [Streptomyces sp. V2I9]